MTPTRHPLATLLGALAMTAALAASVLLGSLPHQARAQALAGGGSAAAAPLPPAAIPLTEGEVRKVDAAAGKLTIKHGPIVNLDMGAMTMVFRVADPAFLDAVKAGDSIRFAVERRDGLLTVTAIEPAP